MKSCNGFIFRQKEFPVFIQLSDWKSLVDPVGIPCVVINTYPPFLMKKSLVLASVVSLFLTMTLFSVPRMEYLTRGVVAVHQPEGKVFVSWRLLATDHVDTAFNLYRRTRITDTDDWGDFTSTQTPVDGDQLLNATPLADICWMLDETPHLEYDTAYFVKPVLNGIEGVASDAYILRANATPLPYHSIPLQTPEGYHVNDASIADLDGDGEFEIVLKQEKSSQDNSRKGITDPVYLQAYKMDGTLLWEINLGINIRAGAHYTQFMVYDLDGDGKAEVACRTADGTVDGLGEVLGNAEADHRNRDGYILKGPEFLTVFAGDDGRVLDSATYLPQRMDGNDNPTSSQMKSIWGDGYGNRMDRFLAGVAYLDGTNPSLVMCRGYYTRTVLAAWDFVDGKLVSRWVFDSDDTATNEPYAGQGDHSLSVADVDGDGRQEIIYGSMVVDDDGTGLYTTGWGHGDALHVSDLVPANPGLEIQNIQERFDVQGVNMRDAATGAPIFLIPSVKAAESGGDKGEGPGRGNSMNIDPRYVGAETWAAGAGMTGVWDSAGTRIYDRPAHLPTNFGIWWDGDLLRELLDKNFIVKFNWETGAVDRLLTAHECSSNNGTKSTPALSGDIWGDWREEVIWKTRDSSELRIYTSTIPTTHRMVTLLQDPQYRMALVWQNVAYNQPPHPSFYLDEAAPLPGWPEIEVMDKMLEPVTVE